MKDYMMALHQRFCKEPECREVREQIRKVEHDLRQVLDRRGQEQLLKLADLENELLDEISLESFSSGLKLPKVEKKEMKTLPVEQLTSFLREARESGVFELYYLDLATGLRRGELLGLKWADIDLEKRELQVKRQVARIEGKIVEAPLKTKNAYRTLPVAENALQVLKQQRKKVGSSPWVFPSPNGGPISPDSVLHKLHGVLKRAGLPRVRFHDLRHSSAGILISNRVPLVEVQQWLGHSTIRITADLYTHLEYEIKKRSAAVMSDILFHHMEDSTNETN